MTKKPQLSGTHVVSDLETLKVLSDPLRMDILRLVATANISGSFCTVKEISEKLQIPPTKLYYHINLLEKHGLLLIGDTQIVSGIIEKQYQIVAEDITVDKDILNTDEISEDEQLESLLETIRSLVDNTYMDIKKSLKLMYMERAVEKGGGPKARKLSSIHFTNSELHLTVEQADSLIDEIRSLMKTYDVFTKRNIENHVETLVFGLSVIMGPHYHKTPRKDFEDLETNE